MSSSLFKSKQHKSRKNLKKLSISAPFANSPTSETCSSFSPYSSTSNVSFIHSPTYSYPVVVLRARYDFNLEDNQEISVKANDYLKLLDRPGNGWIKVSYLDKVNETGLIPASYVDIAVNDQVNPISYEWLNEYKSIVNNEIDEVPPRRISMYHYNNFNEIEVKAPKIDGQEFQTNVYPIDVKVSNVLQNDQSRIWYKVKFTMNDESVVYIGKYYQDFYNLHINLSMMIENLPKLPQPIRTQSHIKSKSIDNFISNKLEDQKYLESLILRCNDLNIYFNHLLKIDSIKNCFELLNFIESGPKVINCNDSNVNDSLYKNSIDLIDLLESKTPHSFSPTAPLPPIESNYKLSTTSPPRGMVQSTSSTTINSYTSLIDDYEEESKSETFDEYNQSIDTEDTSSEEMIDQFKSMDLHQRNDSLSSNKSFPVTPTLNLFDDQLLPLTPNTPILEDDDEYKLTNHIIYSPSLSPLKKNRRTGSNLRNSISNENIKIKIMLNNSENDIIALKMKSTNLISIVYLKKLLSFKIYKDYNLINHYKLIVADQNYDLNDDDLLNYIKSKSKVTLKLVRSR